MKSLKKIALIAVTLLAFVACKKNKEIIYPSSMTYGDNALAIDSITQDKFYSFGAKLGKKATLKVVITNLTVLSTTQLPRATWYLSSPQGWTVSNYGTDETQSFTTNKD